MRFEEALKPEVYNSHPYQPTKKETIYQKNKKKKLKEEYALSAFAATSARDVEGLQKKIKDKIIRRVIKVPIVNIGDIRI